jgi:hypothetical protein
MFYQPQHAYTFPHQLLIPGHQGEVRAFLRLMKESKDPFINMRIGPALAEYEFAPKIKLSYLGFKETHFVESLPHILEADKDVKFIFIVRDPVEVVESWWNHPGEFDPAEDFSEIWRSGGSRSREEGNHFGFDSWLKVVKLQVGLWRKFPARIAVTQYSALSSHPLEETAKLFEHLKLDMSQETRKYLDWSSSRAQKGPYSVGKKLEHQRIVSSKISIEMINEVHSCGLERFLNIP